jgi:hypothetical protein
MIHPAPSTLRRLGMRRQGGTATAMQAPSIEPTVSEMSRPLAAAGDIGRFWDVVATPGAGYFACCDWV